MKRLLETELRSCRRSVWAATTSPISDELYSILLKTIGPKAVLEKQFRGLPGVDCALIFGFWARRYHGEAGQLPQDIDLMVMGDGDVNEIRVEADNASRKVGRDVNVTVLSATEWVHGKNQFIKHVESEPLVDWTFGRSPDHTRSCSNG